MSKKKGPKTLYYGITSGRYVRAWKEGREYAVQVWMSTDPLGEPQGDWAYPIRFGLMESVAQAIIDTQSTLKK